MRRLVSLVVGALVLASALGGCGIADRLGGGNGDASPSSAVGPAKLSRPLELRAVTQQSAAPCAAGLIADTEGTSCYRLAEEKLTIDEVESIKSGPAQQGTGFVIDLTLNSDDAKAFGDLTGRLSKEQTPRNQVAVVVDGKVVTAPAVMDAITGGQVQIAGNFTKASAEKLVKQLTG